MNYKTAKFSGSCSKCLTIVSANSEEVDYQLKAHWLKDGCPVCGWSIMLKEIANDNNE